jgi:hypothetical protein
MVDPALWRQVEALPVAQQLELVKALEDEISSLPGSVVPFLTAEELKALIDREDAEMDADAPGNVDVVQELEALRGKYTS